MNKYIMNNKPKETICNKCKWKRYDDHYYSDWQRCSHVNTATAKFSPMSGTYHTYPACKDKNEGDCPDFERKLTIIEKIKQWMIKIQGEIMGELTGFSPFGKMGTKEWQDDVGLNKSEPKESESKETERKTHRQFCSACHEISRIDFYVSDDIWKLSVHWSQIHDILCLACFTKMADERGIEWDEDIKFYPATQISLDKLRQS